MLTFDSFDFHQTEVSVIDVWDLDVWCWMERTLEFYNII